MSEEHNKPTFIEALEKLDLVRRTPKKVLTTSELIDLHWLKMFQEQKNRLMKEYNISSQEYDELIKHKLLKLHKKGDE